MAKDFEHWAGDSLTVTVTVDKADPGDPDVNLAGATIRWQLFRAPGHPALVSKQTGAGITITGADTFDVQIAAGDTEGLAGTYRHEAEVEDAGGSVATVLQGTVTVKATGIPNA